MEIGNLEGKPEMSLQRKKDLRNNACFTCHKAGCRPWKHGKKKPFIANMELAEEVANDSDEKDNDSLDESEN